MDSLETLFEDTVQKVNSQRKTRYNGKASEDDMVKLYGLYKQAIFGDINIPAPSSLNIVSKIKWNSWNERQGLDSRTAMKMYIRKVEQIENI